MTSESRNNTSPTFRYHRGWHKFGAHETILRQVPPLSRVLDVGCATGYLGATLQSRGCKLWGCDVDSASLAVATAWYEQSRQIDLEECDILPFPEAFFDVVLAADVLEHLRDQPRALRMLRRHIRSDGILIVSLPNVANFSTRLPLLFGQFNYQPTGILDETHVRLFTFKTAIKLVESCGFTVERAMGASDRFGVLLQRKILSLPLRGLLAYNIVLLARPA